MDVGETEVALGRDELENSIDGGMPFTEDAYIRTITGRAVEGGYDVCNIFALLNEAKRLSNL